jgi:hypothetical protein
VRESDVGAPRTFFLNDFRKIQSFGSSGKAGIRNQVAVHQPAQLRAPSNPIRLAKAWQVFWKTLL